MPEKNVSKLLLGMIAIAVLVLLMCCGGNSEGSNDGDNESNNGSNNEESESFSISSTAIDGQGKIDSKYGCTASQDYHRPSIPLSWKGVPAGTKSLILLFDDPDPVAKYWIHWALINLPVNLSQLPENADLPASAKVLENSWGEKAFGGPCPPEGSHNYRIQLFAMSQEQVNLDSKNKMGDELTEEIMNLNPLAKATLKADYP